MAPETRQERRKREKRQREQKEVLDEACSNIPKHLKGRIGGKSEIAESLKAGVSRYGYRGHQFNEDGSEIRSAPLGSAGAQATKSEADARCKELRKKYSKWWGNKKRVRHIAEKEGISEKTIKRYFERCP